MTDHNPEVVDMLAKALRQAWNSADCPPSMEIARLLLDEISPNIHAAGIRDGMERAAIWCCEEADGCDDAANWGGHRKYVQDCKAAAYALRNAANHHRKHAKEVNP